MATRLEKLIIALICGTALGITGCHKPEVENAPGPPPDVAADASTAEDEPAPPPEHHPEPPDQPMYGVPME